MSDLLIPLIQILATIHSLLLSIGGVMVVNAMRALSQTQERHWEIYLDAISRNVPIVDPTMANKEIDEMKCRLKLYWRMNFIFGIYGIIYSIFVVYQLSTLCVDGWFILPSIVALLLQLGFFIASSETAIKALAIWLRKAP